MEGAEATGDRQIILHEDKKYYPDAEELYGDAEALVQMEDTQPLTEPIITPVQSKNFDLLETKMPDTTFDFNFLAAMMDKPNLVRNICLLGAMHHGKTTFMDLMVLNTHEKEWKAGKEIRYTDSRQDEQDRGITVKASSMSLVLQDSKDKSYLFHCMDTPGHANFQDEVIAALALSDGVVLLVDVVVGLTQHTERMLKHALQDKLKVVCVINGLDRLIMELKLPPTDAYHKLRYCIEDINETMEKLYDSVSTEVDDRIYFSPIRGNVLFSSAQFRMMFTLESYAAIYAESHGFSFDHLTFSKCLWGDLYYDADTRKFTKTPPDAEQPRSFVQFVLEPIYKIFAHCLGEEKEDLAQTLAEVGIYLHKRDYELDAKQLIRKVFLQYFGSGGVACPAQLWLENSPMEDRKRKAEEAEEAPQKKPREAEEEDALPDSRPTLDAEVCFHAPDSTLNVFSAMQGRVLMALSEGGMQHLLAGARASAGLKAGRYMYEVKILETLHPSEESSGPFAHTVSLFRDGLRASEPQPLPEHLRNKPLFPHVTFRHVSLQVNMGPTEMKALPFKCRMVQSAAKEDVLEVGDPSRSGKSELLVPVGIPDEGTFEWLDGFLQQHPRYVELSDRKIQDWAASSGLARPRLGIGSCNDKPSFNYNLPSMDDGSIQRVVKAMTPMVPRNYVVMEVKSNLLKEERVELLRRFNTPNFKKTALVVMGAPDEDFCQRSQSALLAEKQAKLDTEWKAKKAAAKRQRELQEMRRKAEEQRKKKLEEAKKKEEGDGETKEEEMKEEKEEEVKEEAKEEEDDGLGDEPPKAELTEEEKQRIFRAKGAADLAPTTLSKFLHQFSLPEKSEGFDEVRFAWDPAPKCKEYLRRWILEAKRTTLIEHLQPSQDFGNKYMAWQKQHLEWQQKQTAWKSKPEDGKAAELRANLDIFSVEDVNDIGEGEPLYAFFEPADWALLQLRYELHLLQDAFKKDVNDPDRTVIPEPHLSYYYNRYFRKQLSPGVFSLKNNTELVQMVKDVVTISGEPPVLTSQLSSEIEVDSAEIFVKFTEEARRERKRRAEAGDETSMLKYTPPESAEAKVEKLYSGDQDGAVAEDMKKMDTTGYLMLHVVKQYHRPDCNAFDVFGRVLSGTVFRGDRVKILGETYSLDDDEDMAIKEIQNLWIMEGRYRVEVSHVPAGNWVLIGGIETCIKKTATITTASNEEEVEIFNPLRFPTTPVVKVAIEPLQPAELPKMVDGLRKIDKAYPLSRTKVEESGEHVLLGTGEVYLDCILHDLRRLYGDLEIKVADPVVEFCETVVETSSLKCFAETPNKKNK
ncbi:unnamed protein product [Effrenium voratum]|nr:unnamed protein product [Effrenium voratum]